MFACLKVTFPHTSLLITIEHYLIIIWYVYYFHYCPGTLCVNDHELSIRYARYTYVMLCSVYECRVLTVSIVDLWKRFT